MSINTKLIKKSAEFKKTIHVVVNPKPFSKLQSNFYIQHNNGSCKWCFLPKSL